MMEALGKSVLPCISGPSSGGWVLFYIVPLLSGSFWHSCFSGVLRLITSPVEEGGHYF